MINILSFFYIAFLSAVLSSSFLILGDLLSDEEQQGHSLIGFEPTITAMSISSETKLDSPVMSTVTPNRGKKGFFHANLAPNSDSHDRNKADSTSDSNKSFSVSIRNNTASPFLATEGPESEMLASAAPRTLSPTSAQHPSCRQS